MKASVKDSIRYAVKDYDAPLCVLDLDAAVDNARDMYHRVLHAAGVIDTADTADTAKGRSTIHPENTTRPDAPHIRLASKSLRIPRLMSHILQLPGYKGILAYHLDEALWLLDTGISDDILVAYPTVHREALRRWLSSPTALAEITIMIDSVEHLHLLEDILAGSSPGAPLKICIDVDASLSFGPVHIGARRSPLHKVQHVRDLARNVIAHRHCQLVGLMAYEGQIAGTADSSRAVAIMKKASAKELAWRREKIIHAIQHDLAAAGEPPLLFVNGGGTGSIESTAAESAITEIGAGSGIIGSGLFDHYNTFSPQPAQWFVLPVVRKPAKNIATVMGGGRIASGAIGADRLPSIDWPAGLTLSPLEGAGEVQTPLRGTAARTLSLGDHVWFRHAKAGEATEHVNSILVVSHGEVIDEWRTYRGEEKSFL